MDPPPNPPPTELFGAARLAVVQRNAAAARAAQCTGYTHHPQHAPAVLPYYLNTTPRPPNTPTRPPCTCFTRTVPQPGVRMPRYEFPPETPNQTLRGFFRWATHNEGFQGSVGRYRLFTAEQGMRERRSRLEDVVRLAVLDWQRMGVDVETARRLRRLAAEYAMARESAWLRGV